MYKKEASFEKRKFRWFHKLPEDLNAVTGRAGRNDHVLKYVKGGEVT